MENWDGYLTDGNLANRDLFRDELPKGLYHLVSAILVRHIYGDAYKEGHTKT